MSTKYGAVFRIVKAGGQRGDEKNDGYLPGSKTYFQVYAPGTGTQDVIAKKMDVDFEGAVAAWDVENWVFVHNDQDGLSTAINHKVDQLDERNAGVKAVVWGREDLRRVLFSMPEADIASVLGAWSPSFQTMSEVGPDDLRHVIEHVSSQPDNPLEPVQPVPHDKAAKNRLSVGVEELLQVGMARMPLVEQYFASDPKTDLGTGVASGMHREYERLRDSGMAPDDIFQELWVFTGGRLRQPSTKHESAVLAILAYFFWTCDVFERSEESGEATA